MRACEIEFSRLDIIIVIMKATEITCPGPIHTWACQQSGMAGGVVPGPHVLSLSYWLLMDPGRGGKLSSLAYYLMSPAGIQIYSQMDRPD